MFQFVMDDNTGGNKYKGGRSKQFRVMGLRHNPYVGTFHVKNFHVNNPDGQTAVMAKQFIMEEAKKNPLIGVFRHSPSAAPNKNVGLKSILYHDSANSPVLSQLQVSREPKIPPHNILRSFKQIPTKVFSTASVGSHSTPSVASPNPQQPQPDENVPTCSICLTPYADGDELRPFACSHCFHNECVSKWIFHRCLDNGDLSSFNCPECRQNHVTLSEASSRTSLAEGISSLSFIQVGENLAKDIGYDFLSDFGSDLQSPGRGSTPGGPSPRPGQPRIASATGSTAIVPTWSADSNDVSPVDDNDAQDGPDSSLVTSTAVAVGSRPGSPRSRPPLMPPSPVRRVLPGVAGGLFAPRMLMLNRTSNRLLGIFPVPEDSYCLPDTAAGDTRSSPTTVPAAAGIADCDASLLAGPLVVSTMTTSTASAAGASTAALTSLPPIAAPLHSWSVTEQALCGSEYSDCGAPLSR